VIFSVFPELDYFPRSDGMAPSVNIVGYERFDGLVPCAESEADGSPSAFTESLAVVQDIALTGFLTIGNELRGLSFTWNSAFTMGVQASWDMASWSNAACVIGDAGANTWTSSVPLDQVGKFFRLRLDRSYKCPEMVY
jgi:hypothetical protein